MYENLASLSTHKDQGLDSYPQIKTTLQEAIKSTVSNTVNKKKLRIVAQQKKEDCFILHASSHAGIIHKERTFPARKYSQSLRGKSGWAKSLLVYCAMVHFSFTHPDQQSWDI